MSAPDELVAAAEPITHRFSVFSRIALMVKDDIVRRARFGREKIKASKSQRTVRSAKGAA